MSDDFMKYAVWGLIIGAIVLIRRLRTRTKRKLIVRLRALIRRNCHNDGGGWSLGFDSGGDGGGGGGD